MTRLLGKSHATDQIENLELIKYLSSNPFYDGHSEHGYHGAPDRDMTHRILRDGERFIRADCPMFFKNWSGLKRVVLRDVAVPDDWISQIKRRNTN